MRQSTPIASPVASTTTTSAAASSARISVSAATQRLIDKDATFIPRSLAAVAKTKLPLMSSVWVDSTNQRVDFSRSTGNGTLTVYTLDHGRLQAPTSAAAHGGANVIDVHALGPQVFAQGRGAIDAHLRKGWVETTGVIYTVDAATSAPEIEVLARDLSAPRREQGGCVFQQRVYIWNSRTGAVQEQEAFASQPLSCTIGNGA